MLKRTIQLHVSRLEIDYMKNPFETVQTRLKHQGFDLEKPYSMYYDETHDSYVYQQRKVMN